jgi:chromosomal replication initiator protein
MYLARRHTHYSLEEIGGHFGGRDHTTVMHAVRTVSNRCETDESFGQMIKGLEDRLKL